MATAQSESQLTIRPFPEVFPTEKHWCDFAFGSKYYPSKTCDMWTGAVCDEIDTNDLLVCHMRPVCYDFKGGIAAFPPTERRFEDPYGWIVKPTARNIQRLTDLLSRCGFVMTERTLDLLKLRWEEREGERPQGRSKLDARLLRGATVLATLGERVRAQYVGDKFPHGEVFISKRVARVGSELQPFVRDPESGAHSQQPIPLTDLDLDPETAARCEDAYEQIQETAAQQAMQRGRFGRTGRTFQR